MTESGGCCGVGAWPRGSQPPPGGDGRSEPLRTGSDGERVYTTRARQRWRRKQIKRRCWSAHGARCPINAPRGPAWGAYDGRWQKAAADAAPSAPARWIGHAKDLTGACYLMLPGACWVAAHVRGHEVFDVMAIRRDKHFCAGVKRLVWFSLTKCLRFILELWLVYWFISLRNFHQYSSEISRGSVLPWSKYNFQLSCDRGLSTFPPWYNSVDHILHELDHHFCLLRHFSSSSNICNREMHEKEKGHIISYYLRIYTTTAQYIW